MLAVAAVVVVGLMCCSRGSEPDVVSRVKGELAAGRKEHASMRLDQIAAELRDLRVLNKRLVKAGKFEESRRVTAQILELEARYQKLAGER